MMLKDARFFQIVFLGSFLTIGVLFRDFSVQIGQVVLVFFTALLTQRFWLTGLKIEHVGYMSAIVSSFGISILVRADNFWVHPLLAALAISSKFLLRIDNNHVFNPANLAAVMAAYLLPGAWLSPGQWGQSWVLAAWFFALGTVVTTKARRIDIGLVFLLAFAALLTTRVFYLGQNPLIIWHQMQNGVLLLFAFFMISDPMTTPREARVRIAYACLVAALAFVWQFYFFKPHGPVLALFVLSFFVPWLNRIAPGEKFQWRPTQEPLQSESMKTRQPRQLAT
jgi:enediyne biosynthesis protein E5